MMAATRSFDYNIIRKLRMQGLTYREICMQLKISDKVIYRALKTGGLTNEEKVCPGKVQLKEI